jgi:periplasmic protein TonB
LSGEATALQARLAQAAKARAAAATAAASTGVFDLSRVDRQPRPTFQARPRYPAELRAAGVTGEVLVEFVVAATGEVVGARAVRSSPNGRGSATSDGAATANGAPPVVKLSELTVAAAGSATLDGADRILAAPLLEAAAVAAVSQWKFEAGQKDGRSVNTRLQVPIVFTLPKN